MPRDNARVRAFLALELPTDVRGALEELCRRIRIAVGPVTWVRSENYHITLRFLGDLDESQLLSLETSVRAGVKSLHSFVLQVKGLGVFPNPARPRVLWAGAVDSTGELVVVNSLAEAAAQSIGLARETKEFHGHVTLARTRQRTSQDLTSLVEKEGDFIAGEFPVRSVALFKSELTSSGSVYTRMSEMALDGHRFSGNL